MEGGDIFVIEATTPRVRVIPLSAFLQGDNEAGCTPTSVAARLKEEHRHCIPTALDEAQKRIGKAYDDAFLLNNDKYYCSDVLYIIGVVG